MKREKTLQEDFFPYGDYDVDKHLLTVNLHVLACKDVHLAQLERLLNKYHAIVQIIRLHQCLYGYEHELTILNKILKSDMIIYIGIKLAELDFNMVSKTFSRERKIYIECPTELKEFTFDEVE
jgi:hypothetical protein